MGLWVRDGATPWQTLVAATRHGAQACGVGAELGTVEVGKLADLIVVGANPLEDITNVRRLQLVLKEGRVVSDKRHLTSAVSLSSQRPPRWRRVRPVLRIGALGRISSALLSHRRVVFPNAYCCPEICRG